jgi:hypothetical protein
MEITVLEEKPIDTQAMIDYLLSLRENRKNGRFMP